ncbi:unnamed protein product, partial [Polarella glacialis]
MEDSTASISDQIVYLRIMDAGVSNSQICVRGEPCRILFDYRMTRFGGGQKVWWPDCSSCKETLSAVPPSSGYWMVLPSGMDSYEYESNYTMEPACRPVTSFPICTCLSESGDRPLVLGSGSIAGPTLDNVVYCVKGHPRCIITFIDGVDLQPGTDYIHIMHACGKVQDRDNLFGGGRAVMTEDLKFKLASAIADDAKAGVYNLCWCRVSSTNLCNETFSVEAGFFLLAGPNKLPLTSITLGESLTLQNIGGTSLSKFDLVRVQAKCGGKSDGSKFIEGTSLTQVGFFEFDPINAQTLGAGTFEFCWCQPAVNLDTQGDHKCNVSEDFSVLFGELKVRCPADKIKENGLCKDCRVWFQIADSAGEVCIFDLGRVFLFLTILALGTCSIFGSVCMVELKPSCAGFFGLRLMGRRIYIDDICCEVEGKQMVLTTAGFFDTKDFRLEHHTHSWRIRVLDKHRLEILDEEGRVPRERADSSRGFLVLSIWRTFLHTCPCPLPALPLFNRVPIAFASPFVYLLTKWIFFYVDVPDEPAIAALFLSELIIAPILRHFWKRRRPVTSIARRLAQFDAMLSEDNPEPQSCARGPHRAVTAYQLFSLYDFFQSFIKHRTMYYLEPNIVRPLCDKFQLSYAERAGPHVVQWFISHYWGTPFRFFCDTVRMHAFDSSGSEDEETWKQQSYWICTLSNNQYRISEELGVTHTDSSFYLALRSASCKGTCLVLDELALPLT